jgi:ubiquinone/menaquinone biosynthesis C-methylase UbiE
VSNPIVEAYSRLASQYDEDANTASCWGQAAARALDLVHLKPGYRVVVDMGCGTGRALGALASRARPGVRLIGMDPAENMQALARERLRAFPGVSIREGSFERIPLETASVDYLYSIFAFHWTTDPGAAAAELARVLGPSGEMDLFFIGRNNGREFIQKTTPIFLRHMGPALLLRSAQLRKQLTREGAAELFGRHFGVDRVAVSESSHTYYDTLDGHWGWWVRVEGHFVQIPPDRKQACDREIRAALASLDGPHGIPYTIHQLHVQLRSPGSAGSGT